MAALSINYSWLGNLQYLFLAAWWWPERSNGAPAQPHEDPQPDTSGRRRESWLIRDGRCEANRCCERLSLMYGGSYQVELSAGKSTGKPGSRQLHRTTLGFFAESSSRSETLLRICVTFFRKSPLVESSLDRGIRTPALHVQHACSVSVRICVPLFWMDYDVIHASLPLCQISALLTLLG
jgi:hypothetical protein